MYCSTHYYINISKHKSLYIQLTFNQKQFYRINSSKNQNIGLTFFYLKTQNGEIHHQNLLSFELNLQYRINHIKLINQIDVEITFLHQ